MKPRILFIEARKKFPKNIDFSQLNKILNKKTKTVSLASTVQYLDLIPDTKKYLESKNKRVIIKKGAFYDAHVLGCQSRAFDKNSDILLLLADGKFHALNNAVLLNREIYVFNPQYNNLEKISGDEIEKIKQKTRAKITKFLSSNRIGILVSTKQGQNYKQYRALKDKIEKLNKKTYTFESNTIYIDELENFPDIEIWINTACYGLSQDNNKIINFQDIIEFI